MTSLSFRLALLSLASVPTAISAQAPPNVLLVIADDLGVDRLRGYHDAGLLATTPTLDSLRAAGLTFANAQAAPACSPSRAALLTGKYGVRNGVLGVPGDLDPAQASLFRAVDSLDVDDAAAADYATALIGKWHLSRRATASSPLAFDMDHFDGFLSGAVDDYNEWSRTRDGATETSAEYATAALTDAALAWTATQTRPWFLWLAHATPHTPYHVPPAGTFTVDNPRNNIRQYVAMIENLDYELGRLLDGLDADTRANTLVLFVGDNGTPGNVMQDYPDGHGKGSLYQGGVRVPLIVAGAGVTRSGEREDALVHIADLHATILEAAGSGLPGGRFNGRSFYGLLSDAGAGTRRYNYDEMLANGNNGVTGYSIRGPRYKVIVPEGGAREIYDLALDSFETQPLHVALGSSLADTISDLLAEAEAIRAGWSCRDGIQNGEETGVDCGTTTCGACTSAFGVLAKAPNVGVRYAPESRALIVEAAAGSIAALEVYDASGRRLLLREGIRSPRLRADLADLPAGPLSAVVTVGDGRQVRRVIVRP